MLTLKQDGQHAEQHASTVMVSKLAQRTALPYSFIDKSPNWSWKNSFISISTTERIDYWLNISTLYIEVHQQSIAALEHEMKCLCYILIIHGPFLYFHFI